jgi:hypothetical protein
VQGGLPAGTVDGGGNIDTDPLFVSAPGDLRLQSGSPCIDAGDNSAVTESTDLEGNARITNCSVDMGAYENQAAGAPLVHNLTQGAFFNTIQAAIDAAVASDVIEVAPCTYNENIDFSNMAITLQSTDPTNPAVVALTIIDGGAAGSVVTCDSGETSTTVLDGFTITNGSANSGGGMLNSGASPTVTNCTFTGNTATFGGGMENVSGSPTVSNCTFSGNTAQYGGGMENVSSSSPTVINCTFSGNTATSHGGGMYNILSSPTVSNCTFSGNAAQFGGGMENSSSSSPTVTNCILWGNSPDEISDFGGTPTISFSDVQGGLPAGTVDGGGNIDTDPLFIDADGPDNTAGTEDDNLRLLAGSPCIDAGSNPAVPAGITTDLDGRLRFVDDLPTPDTGSGGPPMVDIGAYEYACAGSLDAVTDVTLRDFALFNQQWMQTDCGDCGGADFTGDNDVTLEDLLTQTANWLCGTGP